MRIECRPPKEQENRKLRAYALLMSIVDEFSNSSFMFLLSSPRSFIRLYNLHECARPLLLLFLCETVNAELTQCAWSLDTAITKEWRIIWSSGMLQLIELRVRERERCESIDHDHDEQTAAICQPELIGCHCGYQQWKWFWFNASELRLRSAQFFFLRISHVSERPPVTKQRSTTFLNAISSTQHPAPAGHQGMTKEQEIVTFSSMMNTAKWPRIRMCMGDQPHAVKLHLIIKMSMWKWKRWEAAFERWRMQDEELKRTRIHANRWDRFFAHRVFAR